MNNIVEISMLIDFYAGLLTHKQQLILDMHYNNDYSLSEIGENLNISRQGVHDSLKRGLKSLEEYEQKLHLIEKFNSQNNIIYDVVNNLNSINPSNLSNKEKQCLIKSLEDLNKMLSMQWLGEE